VDVRIISATHVDMQAAMVSGGFRADLYHRLERTASAEARTGYRIIGQAHARPLQEGSASATAWLYARCDRRNTQLRLPGNVRELINRIRRAIVMSEGQQISACDLELKGYAEIAPVSLAAAREFAERHAIELALLRCRGRLGDAAKELGISRVTLYRLLNAYGLSTELNAMPAQAMRPAP
jgi:DNA-binding NtrC family response regulator